MMNMLNDVVHIRILPLCSREVERFFWVGWVNCGWPTTLTWPISYIPIPRSFIIVFIIYTHATVRLMSALRWLKRLNGTQLCSYWARKHPHILGCCSRLTHIYVIFQYQCFRSPKLVSVRSKINILILVLVNWVIKGWHKKTVFLKNEPFHK